MTFAVTIGVVTGCEKVVTVVTGCEKVVTVVTGCEKVVTVVAGCEKVVTVVIAVTRWRRVTGWRARQNTGQGRRAARARGAVIP